MTKSNLLSNALLGNALFSGVSGFAFMLFAPNVLDLLAVSHFKHVGVVIAIGASLAFYSVYLVFLATLNAPWPTAVWAAVILDVGWVLGSLLVVTLWAGVLAPAGQAFILALAAVVASAAFLQYRGLSRRDEPSEYPTLSKLLGKDSWVSIGASWMSMKLWIKIWLFVLNGLFIAAVFFWGSDPVVQWIVIFYVATGPFLFAIIVAESGLSRILGVAHLIPWTPLFIYVGLRLISEQAGSQILYSSQPVLSVYLYVFLTLMGSCLALDCYDVFRWYNGERFILGSLAAYKAGASRLVSSGGVGDNNS